jgi:integrase
MSFGKDVHRHDRYYLLFGAYQHSYWPPTSILFRVGCHPNGIRPIMHRASSLLTMVSHLEPLELQLFEARVTPATRTSYRSHYDNFTQYCNHRRWDLSQFTTAHYDHALLKYITHLYRTGQSRGRAATTYSALVFYLPNLKSHLPYSLGVLKGWIRTQPGRSHVPLSWPMTVLIGATMAQSDHQGMGLATLVAFDCYLRINEFVNLRIDDIYIVSGRPTFIRIRIAKTGSNQSVVVSNPDVDSLLQRWTRHRRINATSSQSLFDIPSHTHYRHVFKQTVTALNLTACHYVPHSLRHGGATHSLANNVPMTNIVQRGRWRSLQSATRYLQAGLAIRLDAVIPRRRMSQAAEWCKAEHFHSWMSDALFPDL